MRSKEEIRERIDQVRRIEESAAEAPQTHEGAQIHYLDITDADTKGTAYAKALEWVLGEDDD